MNKLNLGISAKSSGIPPPPPSLRTSAKSSGILPPQPPAKSPQAVSYSGGRPYAADHLDVMQMRPKTPPKKVPKEPEVLVKAMPKTKEETTVILKPRQEVVNNDHWEVIPWCSIRLYKDCSTHMSKLLRHDKYLEPYRLGDASIPVGVLFASFKYQFPDCQGVPMMIEWIRLGANEKRFQITKPVGKEPRIRALQGHSFAIEKDTFDYIVLTPRDVHFLWHRTTQNGLEGIL